MEKGCINVVLIGDIIGEPGRKALFLSLSGLIKERRVDFVIANGENAAGGFGITGNIAGKLLSYGVDCITTGNHIWRNKEIFKFIDENSRLLRPANYPNGTPGRGWTVLEKDGMKLGVLNLLGRVYMEPLECPFRTARREISQIRKITKNIIVDFHGEATSEKVAMGWYLNGQVSAVIGTHTHVQTADERILPGGTAYITDAGMTGPFDSVIGMDTDKALHKFVTLMPIKFTVAENDIRLNGVFVSIDVETGKSVNVERINTKLTN
ncbi:MAG: TIGR00282 family metallophosphoesterase [Spirochaetota bacterium]